ncbi:hypothetical protein BDW42DRAFT_119094 [Aspergillus taichungensis]|uniref:Trafficking protein particle complex subunit 12 n=1 Tax=Aspergillus taichungensis TaxID=482145 RepID=A0A2J5HRL6_9EURO|nr:hypothetical protein BDW42DRAFT_119094 [Aspergillus taichungensis]
MSAPSKHDRNASKSRPRSSTRGPLDESHDVTSQPENTTTGDYSGASFYTLDPLIPDEVAHTLEKDLSFLLRYDNYHSLAQIDIPHALRSDFVAPSSNEPLSHNLGTLERLLAEGHFLLAAYLSGAILTSSGISPTDIKLIFALFYTRLACLELSGNTVLAAQESKALEDLSSEFYYITPKSETSDQDAEPSHPRHIAPWPLRVLAVRLQSIGFGDPRRGIAGLYDIGIEARREAFRPDISDEHRKAWRDRLADLGIRCVNALIEMGDLSAARRSLDSLQTTAPDSFVSKSRKTLLFLLIGDVDAAKRESRSADGSDDPMFKPLLNMAEGRYDDAATEWRALLEAGPKRSDEAMVKQNLAVCLLYTARLNDAREILESLVQENHSFGGLVFNLATVYELCSDKSSKLKTGLVETVARQPITGQTNLDRPNSDFKM